MDTIRKPSTNEASIREKRLFQPISLKSTAPDSSAYLTALSRTQLALAETVKEEPPSPPRCPSVDQEGQESASEARVEALRSLVHEAWTKADGNPADGKWGMIPRLLRLGVTSGRGARWVGTRTDRNPPNLEELGYLNATTEAEWHEWERRMGVQEKVEGWKRRVQAEESSDLSYVDPPSVAAAATEQDVTPKGKTTKPAQSSDSQDLVPSSSHPNQGAAAAIPSTSKRSKMPSAGPAIAQRNQDLLKDKAPFSFSVVKRAQQVTAVGKPSNASQQNSEAAANGKHPEKSSKSPSGGIQRVADVPNLSSVPPPNDEQGNRTPKTKPQRAMESKGAEQSKKPSPDIRNITDIPDLSFAPPSFPESQIITSTPIAQAKPPVSSSSNAIPESKMTEIPPLLPSLLSSPKVTKTYGRSNNTPTDNTERILRTTASLPVIPATLPKLPPVPISPTQLKNTLSGSVGNLVTDRVLTSPHFTPKKSKSAPASTSMTEQLLNANHKRPLDMNTEEEHQQTKKARTISPDRSGTPKQSHSQSRGLPPSPSTPTSLKSRPTESNQAFSKTALAPPDSSPVTTTSRHSTLPTLTELLASAKKTKANNVVVKPKPKPKPKSAANPERRASGSSKMKAKTKVGLRYVSPEPRRESVTEDPYSLYPYELDLSQHPERDILHDLDAGFDIASPAKSLSSIADSDSEAEEDELEEDSPKPMGDTSSSIPLSAFRPFATSTQKLELGSSPFVAGHPSSGSSSAMPVYNSQFSVARRVETVDRLLGKDLDLGTGADVDIEKEFPGWLRGPSLEKEMLDSP